MSEKLSLNFPEWLLSYFETGWNRYQQGLDFQPSTVGQSFRNFDEYVVWVIEELVKGDYERFKIKQREDLNKVSLAVRRALERSLEVERSKNKNI
jgi:hypothetical protein